MDDEVQRVVVEVLDSLDFDLVELRRGGTRTRPVLEARIDRRDDEKVTIDDCARASRAIEARLDASQIVETRYVLQVSSPGERPLRTAAEWRRFVGRWANVLAPAAGGRFEARIVALESAEGAEAAAVAVLQTEQGKEIRVPLAEVKEARLAFHWQR